MDSRLDMTLDEQIDENNRRHHRRNNNSRHRRRRYRDNNDNDINFDGSTRSRKRRRHNNYNDQHRSRSLNNNNRYNNNNNYNTYNNYSNNQQQYNNYNNNNNRSHSSSRRHQYNTNTEANKENFDVNIPQQHQYNPTNNQWNNAYNNQQQFNTTNNPYNNQQRDKVTFNAQSTDQSMQKMISDYKVNEWIEYQDKERKSILTETIGLEFNFEFYASRTNHGWPWGHSFEMEHQKFRVKLDETESKYSTLEILPNDYPLKEYQRRTNETKFHYKKWGQRKLLIAEIQFLSQFFDIADNIIVVYAGAAPGHHTPFLADLFPNIHFELWDPASFHEDNFRHPRITVNNGCPSHHFRSRNNKKDECCYFTDEIAKQYGERVKNGENILFVSDIRTADWRNQNQLDVEDFVLRDNELQMKWVKFINPLKAHLKFRCPYPDRVQNLDTYQYFKGDLYFQPWLAPTSTEMRLVVDKFDDESVVDTTEYNIHKYEQQLFWWNNVARQSFIQNPYYLSSIGFINTYDCWLEAMVLQRYFKKMFAFNTCNNNNNNNNNNTAMDVDGNGYDVLKYIIALTVHRITRMLSPNGNKTLLTRFKGISAHRQIDHTKHYQAMDDEKKRRQQSKKLEKTHLKTLGFNNNRDQKQLKTREYIKELNDGNIKYKSIIKHLKEFLNVNDIKTLLIDKCNNIDNKLEIIKGKHDINKQNKITDNNNNKNDTNDNKNVYKLFYHNNTTHFSLFISIKRSDDDNHDEQDDDDDDDDFDDISNLSGVFIVDFNNDKIEIYELIENHPYSTYITESFHASITNKPDTADNTDNKKQMESTTLMTVVLGKFIYSFDVPNSTEKRIKGDEKEEDSKQTEDDYEYIVHDVLLFDGTSNNNLEHRLKIGDEIITNFNNKITNVRNVRFVLLPLYELNAIMKMYCNFKYFGALNGPTAWNSSFKTDKFRMDEAVRGGILAEDKTMDIHSRYCKIMKCNGLSIININSSSSALTWINDNNYSLIGLNTNLNSNVMLMATNMDECRKSLLYDLKNKENVVGFCTIPKNALPFDEKEYILVDGCIKSMYLTEIDYNTDIETYEKKIEIDGIEYGLSIEYWVSYLPERMNYSPNYYDNVKDDIVYEIDVIQWYLKKRKTNFY